MIVMARESSMTTVQYDRYGGGSVALQVTKLILLACTMLTPFNYTSITNLFDKITKYFFYFEWKLTKGIVLG